MKIYIGTSGFSYGSWKNSFYPADLPSSRWLAYYCTKFNTVELNNTFYRFPVVKNLKTQYKNTPPDFIFTVKAHKIITHTKRMKEARSKVQEFMKIVNDGLKEKLGCVLFQLPPSFKYSEEHLDAVLDSLSETNRNVVEFRHASWWNKKVITALRRHKLTFCNVSFPNLPEDFYKTSPTYYIRMHGVPILFSSPYSDESLKEMVKKIPPTVKECFIYFNNTGVGGAAFNALFVKSLLENDKM